MNYCLVCKDKKRYTTAESQLRMRVSQLKQLLNRLNREGYCTKSEPNRLERATKQLIQADSSERRLMCGRCPHVNQASFKRQEKELKELVAQLIGVAYDLPSDKRKVLFNQLNQLLRGDYQRISYEVDRLNRTLKDKE